jgi:hypothetical protein
MNDLLIGIGRRWGIEYLNYLVEEDVDGLPVLGLLVYGLLAQPQQARASQRQELLNQSSLLFHVADPDPGSSAFLTLWIRDPESVKSYPGS